MPEPSPSPSSEPEPVTLVGCQSEGPSTSTSATAVKRPADSEEAAALMGPPSQVPVKQTPAIKRQRREPEVITPEELQEARQRIRDVSRRCGWKTASDLQNRYAFWGMAEYTALQEEIARRKAREAAVEQEYDSDTSTTVSAEHSDADAEGDWDPEYEASHAAEIQAKEGETGADGPMAEISTVPTSTSSTDTNAEDEHSVDAASTEVCEGETSLPTSDTTASSAFPSDPGYSIGFRRPVLWREGMHSESRIVD